MPKRTAPKHNSSSSAKRAVSEPTSNHTRLVLDNFRRIVRVLRVASRAAEKNVGVTAAQLFVLSKLSDGKGISLNELSDRTLTHQSSVSVVVQRLVSRGMVVSNRSREDGRRVELSITPSARAVLRKAPDAAQERLIAALNSMNASRRKMFGELLQELVEAMGTEDDRATMLFEEEDDKSSRKRFRRRA